MLIDRAEWTELAATHARAVDRICAPVLARRRAAEPHPTQDFLWNYYSLRPNQLRRWHPGLGIALADAAEYTGRRGYEVDGNSVASVSSQFLAARAESWLKIHQLLTATAGREPRYGCAALHEWAMVYGLSPDEIRHRQVPLRLSEAEVREVVEAAPLLCTHYDAFRFYTPAARPLNRLQLTRESQVEFEQPACLHANMDLYKWAYKLLPAVSSELLLKCLELAQTARELDMAASPYDNRAWGIEPIAVETAAGRAEFAERQRALSAQAAPLRDELISVLTNVVAA